MADRHKTTLLLVVWLFLATLTEGGHLAQEMQQATGAIKDVTDLAPDYTVPVQGASENLPGPRPGFALTYLTLARGNMTYTCEDRRPAQTPVYISQFTTLWDAAPLLPHIADESQFHTIVPQLYDFDYAMIANSSLVCVGTIETVQGSPIVDIFGSGMFRLSVEQTVQGPEQSREHLEWAYETSDDGNWEVYRVETVSSAVPTSCEGQRKEFDIDYAAEYWFFHA